MQKYWNTVLNERGEPRSGARVAVQQSGSNSTVYSDQAGSEVKTNPLTTDSKGYFEFYAASGEYDLVVTGTGFDDYTITDGALVGMPSDDVSFVQSGSGAIARNVQSKLRDTVNVFDFMTTAQIADVQALSASVDCSAAIQAAWDSVAAGGEVFHPRGTYLCSSSLTLPVVANVTLRGANRSGTIFKMASTKGVGHSGSTRVAGLQMHDISIESTPTNNATGLDLNEIDRAIFYNLRVTGFVTGVRVRAESLGAYHNTFINPRFVTNTTGLKLTGALGANQTHVIGGEISSNTTGVDGDAPADGCEFIGTSFESNTTAIDWNGKRSAFLNVRFEGNTADTSFGANAEYNSIRTGFFDSAKHTDASTANSNVVEFPGFFTGATEAKEIIETMDPADATTGSLVCDAANRGWYVLVVPRRLFRAVTLSVVPIVSPGGVNIDLGIAEFGGNVIASTGSTALGAANTIQSIALTSAVWLNPGKRYYLIISFDTAVGSASVFGNTPGVPAVAAGRYNDIRFGHKASVFPLSGTTSSGLSTPNRIPWIRVT